MRRVAPFLVVSVIAVLGMILIVTLVGALSANAAPRPSDEAVAGETYYVDFEGGDDVNDGLSAATAWKHAPGDSEAIGNPDSVDLEPGDTVLFKGGVTYRGNLLIEASGAEGQPITYKGDGWGDEKAIIEGAAPITTTWTQCESQQACGGNPDWQNVYYTDAPAGVDFTQGFYEDDDFIWQAQDPNPDDPFYYDRIEYFRVITQTDPTVSQTTMSITDPGYFTQTDPSAWDGASVVVWRIPNVTEIVKITDFDPAAHTVTHEELSGDIYDDRDSFYAVLNHLRLLDQPGEYVLDEVTQRLYVWPSDSDHPDQHTYSVNQGGAGIRAYGKRYLVIEGFKVQKFTMGIRAIRDETSDVVIRDNQVRLLRSNDWYAVQVGGDDMLVERNAVTDCQRAIGILATGNRVTVRDNFVKRTSRQGIHFGGIEDSEILDNVVTDIRGTHSNGISVYLHHRNILVAGNRVWNVSRSMTYHGNHDPDFVNDLTIYNNFFAGSVHSWGKGMRGVAILNNTFLQGIFFSEEDQDVVFINNVVNAGGGGEVRSHNVYIGLSWSQRPRYGWAPGPGEIVGWDPEQEEYVPIDPQSVLVDPEEDYRLQPDSPAIDAGTDVTAYLPAPGEFSYPYLDADIDGNPRPCGAAWDMGAGEFMPSLELRGVGDDGAIHLDWTVNVADPLPPTATWRINYYTQPTNILTATEPLSTTRSHTLTGLTNYAWYTVTLSTVDTTPILSDTVRVMPTDTLVYLPIAMKAY